MMNQDMRFDPLSLFGLLKRMNGSDPENVVHRSPQLQILGSGSFCKYLKSVMDLDLKFDPMTVLNIIKRINSSDHVLEPTE